MTGVSPLQNFHKKGLFGDHHKKNEKDLIVISEIKEISIFQIVKYKKSKLNLLQTYIDDLKFSERNSKVENNENTRILWNGPRNWIVVSKKNNIIDDINKVCSSEDFAITDISHSTAIIQLKGFQAKEVLKKGCPINFNEIKKNYCLATIFQGINILIDVVDDKPDTFNIFALRSFGESFYHDITDASLEFGYLGA